MFNIFIKLHKDLFLWIHSFSLNYPEYHHAIYIIAEKLDNYVIILAFFTLFYFVFRSIEHTSYKRFKYLAREGIKIVISVGISWGISYLIKNILKAPRPYLRFPHEVTRLFDYGGFDSFPSGHATLFMALAVMIFLHHKRSGYIFLCFAFIIPLARVISGVHFPIDIIVGWAIGGGLSLLIYKKLHF